MALTEIPIAMPQLPTETQITAIYRETVAPLYGYVSRRCGGDRQVAEDVTQETWLRAVREWRRAGVPETPLAWLTTVARNLLLNLRRRPEALPIDDVAPTSMLEALDMVDRDAASESAERSALVVRALTRIPADEARLLEAFHFERCRVAHLAERYGISERAVEGRLRRAREHLRTELELTLPKAEGGFA